ncbi:hypothetical protein [Sulfobacillus thermosulfidooxidans]|uniref:hypothetical protein n=1 Tax=Sulfobacillus thermosulfidooxidans TaxID=28034 RepID=UPI0006B61758|nr:hypothetical protein [Sulfobacillus thermosulfidooxidans]
MHFVIWAYVTYLLTFILGVVFFIRFDLKKKKLPPSFLAVHFFLTVMTFIFFSSAMAPYLKEQYGHPTVSTGVHSSNWLNLERHDHMLHQKSVIPPSKGA